MHFLLYELTWNKQVEKERERERDDLVLLNVLDKVQIRNYGTLINLL